MRSDKRIAPTSNKCGGSWCRTCGEDARAWCSMLGAKCGAWCLVLGAWCSREVRRAELQFGRVTVLKPLLVIGTGLLALGCRQAAGDVSVGASKSSAPA